MPLSAHEFERRLIFYASPTLTKLKVACIYNLNDLDDLEECIQYYNELLNKKDIYLKVLKIKGRSMIYVYQKEKLNKLCACKQIQNIFKKYNYNCLINVPVSILPCNTLIFSNHTHKCRSVYKI